MSEITLKRRHPAIATLMSFALPGWGQLYNGQLNRALWFFLFFIFSLHLLKNISIGYLPTQWIPLLPLLGMAAALLCWLYGVVDAWRTAAKRSPAQYVWQASSVYLLAFIVGVLLAWPGPHNRLNSTITESFQVPSRSMEPSVLKGDVLFVNKRYNCPGCNEAVKQGDIVVFVYPNNRNIYFIKRVIGLPGDQIRIRQKTVFVNRESLTKNVIPRSHPSQQTLIEGTAHNTYRVQWSNDDQQRMDTVTVPTGAVFVMGDNRSNSQDSRVFSSIPLADVIGKAKQVWFSSEGGRIRWERIGEVLH